MDEGELAGGPLRIALTFLAVGVAWILTSDWFTSRLLGASVSAGYFQTLKGIVFISGTSVLVYWLAVRAKAQLHEVHRTAQLDAAARVSETILSAIGEAVLIIDAEERVITDCNPAAETMFGIGRDALVGRDLGILLPNAADLEMVSRVGSTAGEPVPGRCATVEMRHAEGARVTGEITLRSLSSEAGSRPLVVGVIKDVTERVEALRALRVEEAKARLLADSTLDMIWSMDLHLVFQHANPATLTLLGFTPEELIGTHLSQYLLPSDLEGITELIRERAALPASRDAGLLLETRVLHRDGSLVPVEVHGIIQRDTAGRPVGIQGSTRDIRQRLESATRLQTVIERLNSLRRIDQSISAVIPIGLLQQRVVVEACSALGVDAAAVLLVTEPEHRLRTIATTGFRTPLVDAVALRLDEGLTGRAAMDRLMIASDDVQAPDTGFARADIAAAEDLHSFAAAPMIVQGRVVGILEVFRREVRPLQADELEFLEMLAGQAAIGTTHIENVTQLEAANERLLLAYDANIEGWSRALDYRDHETQGHSTRVTAITVALARAAGIPEEELRFIRWGALLHDIGKMGVPDAILLKPGPLTEEEWAVVRQHPTIARKLLEPISYLARAMPIPYSHHEAWDGTGYPQGLAGEEIPLAARLFAVVDVWDAMRSSRSYRTGQSEAQVLADLRTRAGRQLDPTVVELFVRIMPEIPECRSMVYASAPEPS